MTWISHSLPPEAEDPPPALPAPPSRLDELRAARAALLQSVRPRIRSERQERIRRRIVDLTLKILVEETSHAET